MLGSPGLRITSTPTGPFSSFSLNAGSFMAAGLGQYGIEYMPGATPCFDSASRAAASSGRPLMCHLCAPRTFQMSELATNTTTADTTIGSHSPVSVSTATSLWIGDGPHPRGLRPEGSNILNPLTPAVRLSR